ncbi:dolichyl-phosphate-mannose--protein O-mannosyl transferase [Microlunatus capsulatus]|uniref:Polyprenol-phosphate-mannose--protein mannosyltransferase n=2 Tax=Microlunatus capsulatus TaxID=99117 RepID=A0ABS4ZAR1_9ACTN|nr:dolichyl-phosphate-mannose--protein O-mannosyl transferase [Microlunatus capsulatus]
MTEQVAAVEHMTPVLDSPRSTPPPVPRPPTTRERLRDPLPADRLTGWLVTLVIAGIAFGLRVVGLGYPNKLVFDETYYAKDAYSLLRHGYERSWPSGADASVTGGTPDVMLESPSFIVHPPVGKWLIAGGEQLFGMNAFGWRFASLVFGTLLVVVTIRLVRRVSRSTLVGGIAGLLLTFDGLAFVMARTALLDIFLAFFVVAAVACLAADRDWMRARLADHLEDRGLPDLGGRYGPLLLVRPWRIAAGVCFGLALGSKWNAIYLLAAFALLSLAWDVGARRLAGAGWRAPTAVLRDGVPAFVSLVVLSALVYVGTWAGWLATSGGYDRQWGAQHPDALSTRLLGDGLASLLQYQRDIYAFHTGSFINSATHAYRADPAGWLVVARPIGIDAVNGITPGTDGCLGPDNCIRVISGMGTPVLWWAAVFALGAAVLLWVGGRDWRFGIPVVGVLAAWLPWFSHDTRPLFYFYAIAIIPFSVMAVALCLGRVLGPRDAGDRRMVGAIVVGAFVALVAANFAYLYPILTDTLLPYPAWLSRMWFRSWI